AGGRGALGAGGPKWMMGITGPANFALVRRGIQPAEPLALILIAIETLGGLCIALGLFTRFWAAAATIEMTVIIFQYTPKFGWTGPGFEYPLFWCIVMLIIVLRGGGAYSLARRIGRER